MAFLHKELSEKEREEINEDVKGIVNSFGAILTSLGELPEEGSILREKSMREETCEFPSLDGFRERIFENAPRKNKDFIIAEKKSW